MCTFCNGKEFFAVALSKLAYTLSSIAVQVVGFDSFKRPYPSCEDFSTICVALVPRNSGEYGDFLHDWYCFKGTRLCLPKTSFHEQVILELHAGETTGHFGRDKTITMVENHFYWPSLKKMWLRMSPDIEPANYQRGKGRIQVYTCHFCATWAMARPMHGFCPWFA